MSDVVVSPMGLTEVELVGTPRWRHEPTSDMTALAPRDAALLALLAIEGSVPRDLAAAWIWPGVPQQNANLSLRQRIFRLRQQAGRPLVHTGSSLSLTEAVSVDLHREPVPVGGALLAGIDYSAFDEFDGWLHAARQVLAQRQADVMAGQAAQLEARGELAAAIALCERIVAIHPPTEHAWRRLMRLHWLRADRAAAIATFERFEQRVCRELGLRPSAETLDLLERVERLEAARSQSRPDGLPPGLLRPPLLVGREPALQAVRVAWSAGRAALVMAAGGMGKSRLLETLAQSGPGALLVRARPGDAALPFGSLRHALSEAIDRFAPQLTPECRGELARLLPELGAAPTLPALPQRLCTAIDQAWSACRAQGLEMLLLDDLHWSDTATLEHLHAQLANPALAGLRCAFAARPDEDTPAAALLAQWLGDSLRAVPVTLSPWDADELLALLDSLALPWQAGIDRAAALQLHGQTGGQPFFVLELLKTLWASPQAGDAQALPLPPAVGAAITRRLQRLSAEARQLLQLLAVANGELRLDAASRVLQRSLPDLAADWAQLAAAQLVQHSGSMHDLVREAVLVGLPLPARQALHLALARALSGAPGVRQADLAAHWQAAQAWPEAAQAWAEAARMAVGAARLADAVGLFAQAAEACRCASDTGALVTVLQSAQATRLAVQGAEAVCLDLATQLRQPCAPADRVRLLLLLAEAEMARMRFPDAEVLTGEAVRLAHGLPGGTALQADLAIQRGRALAWSGRTDEGVALLRQACHEADVLGDLRRRLTARHQLSDVLVPARRRVESVRNQHEVLELARQLGDPFEHAMAASNLAVFEFLVGHAAASLEAAREALQAFQAMGAAHVDRVMCAAVFSYAAAHAGRFDEVADTVATLLDAPPTGPKSDPVLQNLRNVCSTVALWRGRPDEALALLPALDDESALSVRLTGLQARLRWHTWTGSDAAQRAPWLSELQALGEAHPALREDPHFYRGWAHWDPPEQALARLDRLAQEAEAEGASALARSLSLVALQILLPRDAAAAAGRAEALFEGLALGFHPAIYPPEAWWAVAQALAAGGRLDRAASACRRARQWIERTVLPATDPRERQCFLENNPVNRAVLHGLRAVRPEGERV